MNPLCEQLERILERDGADAIAQPHPLADHVVNCESCRTLLAAFNDLPDLLAQLPTHSAPSVLISKVQAEVAVAPAEPALRRHGWLPQSLAAAVVALASFALIWELTARYQPDQAQAPLAAAPQKADAFGQDAAAAKALQRNQGMAVEAKERDLSFRDNPVADVVDGLTSELSDESFELAATGSRFGRSSPQALDPDDSAIQMRPGEPQLLARLEQEPERRRVQSADGEVRQNIDGRADLPEPSSPALSSGFYHAKPLAEAVAPNSDLLAQYDVIEGLSFHSSHGYWANTYIPGDPAVRLLDARIQEWKKRLQADQPLEQLMVPYAQPLDPPVDHAVSMQLLADRAAVAGPSRLRMQIALRGIEHRRGQRQAMNTALVIDLPADAAPEQRIAARALVEALLGSKQAGDRFALVASGSGGGLLVAPEAFAHGPVQAAIQQLLAPPSGEPELDLADSLKVAAATLKAQHDPAQPLGSSSILLVTAGPLSEFDQLRSFAHSQAQTGVTLSVAPLGSGPPSERVEALVLAGLGQRRLLSAPAQAATLIEAELHAASRAVARAARLAIQLAPGVKLIDVIGSHPLGQGAAQRVRTVEQSMDQRLSEHFSIRRDRGQDEEGIQIVIPTIFGGDQVIVLLDLWVDQGGPLATVSLRYKDLVFLRNGATSKQLVLASGDAPNGPAQWAVRKNLLAHHVAQAVGQAADALAQGQVAQARTRIQTILATIRQARQRIPAWQHDPDLNATVRMLDRYLGLLVSDRVGQWLQPLEDSLRIAAWRTHHRWHGPQEG